MSSLQDLINEMMAQQAASQSRRATLQDLVNRQRAGNSFGRIPGAGASAAADIAAVNKMLRALPKRKSPAERIKEIEHELQIIKGQIPTPKGYTITPSKAKRLVQELRELRAKL